MLTQCGAPGCVICWIQLRFPDLLDMSFSLLHHFFPVLSLETKCLLNSELLSCFSGVMLSIRLSLLFYVNLT